MKKIWLISVNMGYGHQRTVYPLRNLAEGGIINANDYQGIPGKDRKIWESSRKFYELISRFQRVPLVGKIAFSLYDQFQKILNFYPRKIYSRPNFAIKQIYSLLKRGWGKELIERLAKNPLPIVTTFFTPAFMAEFFDYPGQIFLIVCDADISRTWTSFNPKASRIKYFAPTERVAERLKLYGVKEENIFLTGYPLPLENTGSENLEILKNDLKYRLLNLDPQRKYFEKYKTLIEEKLGKLPEKSDHPLTILFSVGGAGVQKEIGASILKCLSSEIKEGKIKIILSAGIKEKVREYFLRIIGKLNFKNYLNKNIEIIFSPEIEKYFSQFNQVLRKTDILWTKPSELSFYSALGIPIIIAPPLGSQEEFNKRWLLKSGFGLFQEDPSHLQQWLFDWLDRGYLAEAAMEGFVEGEKMGTVNIQKIIEK